MSNGNINFYRGPNGGNSRVNLYGGPRRGNNRPPPYLNKIQLRRIMALIVQLFTIYYLVGVSMDMTSRDALKIRSWLLQCIISFKNIATTYFSGYQKGIEATAAALVSVIWRKLQSGRGLNISNAVVAATAFGMAYKTGNGSLNTTVKRLGSYNNST